MEKSLLDIIQPKQKYNFRAYRKESYKHLQFLLDRVREKAQHLCEESITSGEYEKGCLWMEEAGDCRNDATKMHSVGSGIESRRKGHTCRMASGGKKEGRRSPNYIRTQ